MHPTAGLTLAAAKRMLSGAPGGVECSRELLGGEVAGGCG
jgi:hypothetical protein